MNFKRHKNENSFQCKNCKKEISESSFSGTSHRNHCPFCGYSLHVDTNKGDRTSDCGGLMKPIGLMFKGGGELCLVHLCLSCSKVNFNRIAADDEPKMILNVLHQSYNSENTPLEALKLEGISLIGRDDENEVKTQLYGLPA